MSVYVSVFRCVCVFMCVSVCSGGYVGEYESECVCVFVCYCVGLGVLTFV
jgi:hypothetical protein